MNIDRNKYNKSIGCIIIFAYSILFLINLLHYHPVNFQFDLALDKSTNNYSEHFSSFSELDCSIHNIFTSIHNYSPITNSLNIKLFVEDFLNIYNLSFFPVEDPLNLSLLRAPPIVFS